MSKRELPPSKTADETSEYSARSAVGQYFRVWNDGDVSSLAYLLATDWVDHAHPDRRSIADVMQAVTAEREQHSGTRVLVDAVLGGEVVTVCGRVVSDDHTEKCVWIVRVEGDRLQEIWTYPAD